MPELQAFDAGIVSQRSISIHNILFDQNSEFTNYIMTQYDDHQSNS